MEPVAPARVERRLAAVLAADVAGDSRLIGAGKEGPIRPGCSPQPCTPSPGSTTSTRSPAARSIRAVCRRVAASRPATPECRRAVPETRFPGPATWPRASPAQARSAHRANR